MTPPPPPAPRGMSGPKRPTDDLGTLREPLLQRAGAAGAPGAPATDGPDARVLMKGELQPGLLSDIIQLFAQNSETGRLYIEGVDRVASIYLTDGAIVNAQCDDVEGERAFFEAMNISKGRFSYQRGVRATDIRINRTAQHLIMEALRLIDEQA
jgi:hypothetical protein